MDNVQMSIFFTSNPDPVSWLIRWFQTPWSERVRGKLFPYSHCGVLFQFDKPVSVHGVYFAEGSYFAESIFKKKKDSRYGRKGSNGVRFPVPHRNLHDWVCENEKRKLEIIPIPPEAANVEHVIVCALQWRLTVRYAPIGQMLAYARNMFPTEATPSRMTCSEFLARALCWHELNLWYEVLNIGDMTYDMINPRHMYSAAKIVEEYHR